MNPISFKASFVAPANISKKSAPETYYNKKVSIVELDKNDANDLLALSETTRLWTREGARYASEIFHEAVKDREYDDVVKEHYFALTEQNKNIDKLEPNKILGLMLFSESRFNENEINWFQVRPNSNFVNSHDREYKYVGKSMINMLKNKFPEKTIYVKSSEPAVGFYKAHGFQSHTMEPTSCLYLDV